MTRKPSIRRSTAAAKEVPAALKIVPPVMNEGSDANSAVAIKMAVDRIKDQLAKHGITLSMPGDQGAGGSFSVTIGKAIDPSVANGVAGAGGTEIATQHNAPLVIKVSGPITIDIGAIIMNSND